MVRYPEYAGASPVVSVSIEKKLSGMNILACLIRYVLFNNLYRLFEW